MLNARKKSADLSNVSRHSSKQRTRNTSPLRGTKLASNAKASKGKDLFTSKLAKYLKKDASFKTDAKKTSVVPSRERAGSLRNGAPSRIKFSPRFRMNFEIIKNIPYSPIYKNMRLPVIKPTKRSMRVSPRKSKSLVRNSKLTLP